MVYYQKHKIRIFRQQENADCPLVVGTLKSQRGVAAMGQVMQTFKRKDAEKRISVLRIEIDYELVSLHDAMLAQDAEAMKQTKARLEKLRQEFIRLEA